MSGQVLFERDPRIRAAIREYMVSHWLDGDERGLADDTDLQESGLLDSITTLALVAFLETSFAIRLEPIEVNAESFRTVDAIVRLVDQKAPPAAPGG